MLLNGWLLLLCFNIRRIIFILCKCTYIRVCLFYYDNKFDKKCIHFNLTNLI